MSGYSHLENTESFLVITTMVLVDAVDKLLQMWIVCGQVLCVGQLGIVSLAAAAADAFLVIMRNQER